MPPHVAGAPPTGTTRPSAPPRLLLEDDDHAQLTAHTEVQGEGDEHQSEQSDEDGVYQPEEEGEPLGRDGSVPGTETAEETIARLRAERDALRQPAAAAEEGDPPSGEAASPEAAWVSQLRPLLPPQLTLRARQPCGSGSLRGRLTLGGCEKRSAAGLPTAPKQPWPHV